MFSNIGGLEILFVAMVALIVLGPAKLPEAARQMGKFVSEVRRISSGFQKEFREAVQDPIIEAEARARGGVESARNAVNEPFKSVKATVDPTKKNPTTDSSAKKTDPSPAPTPKPDSTDD